MRNRTAGDNQLKDFQTFCQITVLIFLTTVCVSPVKSFCRVFFSDMLILSSVADIWLQSDGDDHSAAPKHSENLN